jgi:hypothetical protein
MKKEQALDKVEILLDTLSTYKVIPAEIADALLEDLILIIDQIDDLEPTIPIWGNHPSARKRMKELGVEDVTILWEALKKHKDEDDLH